MDLWDLFDDIEDLISDMTSSIGDLFYELPEKFFEFMQDLINAPISPLVDLVRDLLSEPVNIAVFQSLWVLIVYVLSLFYGLLILWSGFNFIVSGHDAVKRENAKTNLKNIIIMIILLQASYFLYDVVLEISAKLTEGVLDIIEPEFFLIKVSGYSDLGMELSFSVVYLAVLVITSLLLCARQFLVILGIWL